MRSYSSGFRPWLAINSAVMGRELETVIWLSGQWEIGFEAGYNSSLRPAHLKNAPD
jgi:hypothetical protein